MTLEITPELERVRAEADRLGVSYHHRAGVEKIKGLINAHIVEQQANQGMPAAAAALEATEETQRVPSSKERLLKEEIKPLTAEEFRQNEFQNRKRKAGQLIRVRVQCMNPNKKDWAGEIISVGSAKLGTFKKYVPFNNEPYHIPKIIYDVMKEKKCSVFTTKTDHRGNKTRVSRLVPEYAIEVLPPLSKAELQDLAIAQARADGQVHN